MPTIIYYYFLLLLTNQLISELIGSFELCIDLLNGFIFGIVDKSMIRNKWLIIIEHAKSRKSLLV